eukprot:GHUV01000279.1.p1 GENE.GHUV01000279.1~~GHUV01000279.1.p1  ORF type:complete len:297 (+),score=66.58 GHUV01000279.1:219-1109(+)
MMLRSRPAVGQRACVGRTQLPRVRPASRRLVQRAVAFKEEEDTERLEQKNAAAKARAALDKILRRQQNGELHQQTTATDTHGRAGSPVPGFKPTSAPPAYEAPLSVPVFSRRREVIVGRIAMAGFYSACMWEAFTFGLGPVSQLTVSSGLPPFVVQAVLMAFTLHGLWGLSPLTPTWSSANRHDLLRRPRGPPRAFINPFSHPDEFFGYSEWGFTKRNEVFAGRIAMLGFLGTCLAEPIAGGRGALGQIAWWLHLPVSHTYYQFTEYILLLVPIVFGVAAYINRRPGELKGGDDIY